MAPHHIRFDPPRFQWGRVLRVSGVWFAVRLAATFPGSRVGHGTKSPAAPAAAEPIPPLHLPKPVRPEAVAVATEAPTDHEMHASCAAHDLAPSAGGDAKDAALRHALVARIATGGSDFERGAALVLGEGDAARRADELARMAASSSDARLYRLALKVCHGAAQAGGGACQLLSIDQWARLDPSNAAPWLHMAERARDEQNASALAEALHHVAKAQRSDAGYGLLAGTVAAHVPPSDAYAQPALRLMVEALKVEPAWGLDGLHAVVAHCSDDALRDANRRLACSDIAEVLATRSTSMLENRIGLRLARRVGWPEARVAALQAESDALLKAVPHDVPAGAGADCTAVRHTIADVREIGAYGEVGAARRRAERHAR
jgi:hypothetical protein